MFAGNPIEKILMGRPRRKWEDDIRMDLKEIGASTRNALIRLSVRVIGEPL